MSFFTQLNISPSREQNDFVQLYQGSTVSLLFPLSVLQGENNSFQISNNYSLMIDRSKRQLDALLNTSKNGRCNFK